MNISPVLIFLAFVATGLLFLYAGKAMASNDPVDEEAKTSYAGGENIPGEVRFPGYERFFSIALFFTILHVLALLVGLMPAGALASGIIYTGIICFSLAAILLQ